MKTIRTEITAWYMSSDRLYQLLGAEVLQKVTGLLPGFQGRADFFSSEGMVRVALKEELEKWLYKSSVPTLCELVLKNGHPQPGERFVIYHDFYGKGLKKYSKSDDDIPRGAVAELHNKLRFVEKDSAQEIRVKVVYSPAGLCSSTAWSRLSGHTRLFVFGYVDSVEGQEILTKPYIIGDLHKDRFKSDYEPWRANFYGEVHVSHIDSFRRISKVFEKEKIEPDLAVLKETPEKSIKRSVAEILHEGNIPGDWAGEKSDLFTSNLVFDGRRYTAAFLFKGPSRFREMKVADLGKNGDQIDRLYSEPAQFCILQHCHKISTAVRNTMKAYASRIHDLRYFTIIDGYDTIRLLQAYNKCGFSL